MREFAGVMTSKRVRVAILVLGLGLTASFVAEAAVKPDAAPVLKPATEKRWYQIGKASWYGRQFHGHKTASGERFDMYALTCAHRTLPLGSWIKVTNLHNQRTVILRVNDRGPMSKSLIVDLSSGAAKVLGVDGLAQVRIDKLEPIDPELVAMLMRPMSEPLGPLVLGR
jgi:rare lipoprotein A